ncbi:hypothetical protein [Tautonia plasticadhaerens]|nr:hypothetical protein [Tautonia plasticadhaerens]
MLATWVPHYLGWPWWPDLDTFAASAICWEGGLSPYRDLAGYSFPGPIYLFYGIHAAVGAGTTWAIYAVDAAMVVGLVLMLSAWSRRRFDRWWPGLVGGAAVLAIYTDLNFSLVAQRDWQATCLVVLALLGPTTWPGRPGRVFSALAIAGALTFRPHVVLFGPALLIAVVEGERSRGADARPGAGAIEWGILTILLSILSFAPLILHEILDDLVRNLKLATYGSHYSRATPEGMIAEVVRQFVQPGWLVVPLSVALLAGTTRVAIRREAIIWLTTAACVLLYKPLHPRAHDYLDLPRWIVWSVLLALLAAILESIPWRSPRHRLVASIAVLATAVPSKPDFCNPRAAFTAIASAWGSESGGGIDRVPPGYVHHDPHYEVARYPWADYRRALEHLRDEVGPSTSVANLLGYQLAAAGATGHRPVFRNESGLLWKSQVGWEDGAFVEMLEAEANSVVIWAPGREGPEPGLISPVLVDCVRRLYEPDRRFGVIEVWRRAGDGGHRPR